MAFSIIYFTFFLANSASLVLSFTLSKSMVTQHGLFKKRLTWPAHKLSMSSVSMPASSSAQDSFGRKESLKAKLPLKIAVAGSGVGGVFVGYALQSCGFDVTVLEKTAKFSRFGGPIQLASNALSCVNSLSPSLFDQIMERFTFTGTRTCGIKDGIRNRWYSVFDAIKNLAEWNSLPYTGVIDRPDLQDILLRNMKPGTVLNSMQVSKYIEHEGGASNAISLSLSSASYAYLGSCFLSLWKQTARLMWRPLTVRN